MDFQIAVLIRGITSKISFPIINVYCSHGNTEEWCWNQIKDFMKVGEEAK